MGSIAGKTKMVTCTVCGDTISVSLYASAKSATCKKCKKSKKAINTATQKPLIQDAKLQAITSRIDNLDTKPIKVQLVRNRSEIESIVIMDTGEAIDRIPTEWKNTKGELDYLSVSKMETYARCPARFYNNDIDNDNPEQDNGNVFTWFGTILHAVTERMDIAYKDNGILLSPVALFDEEWKKNKLTDFPMYKEGRNLIEDYFKRNPIQDRTHKCISVEYEYRGPLGKVPAFGNKFDYIGCMINDEDTGIIIDYKSNRVPYTTYQLQDSLQLTTYEIIARMIYPHIKKWITGYELFRFGFQQCPTRSQDDLDATLNYIENIYHQMIHDNTWEERLNVYCGYCNIRHKCKTYCNFINDPQKHIDTIKTDKTNLDEVEQHRELVATYYKIIGDRKKELDRIMKTHIQQATINGEGLVINGQQLYLQSQSRPFYDYTGVRNIMAIHGKTNELDRCISVNKTKLDTLAKKDIGLQSQLKQCLISNYTEPYIMKRKV